MEGYVARRGKGVVKKASHKTPIRQVILAMTSVCPGYNLAVISLHLPTLAFHLLFD